MALPTFANTATDDRYWDAEMQRREADEDRRVAKFKMNRDMAAISRPVIAASEPARNYLRDLMLEKAVKAGHDADQALININAWIARHPGKAEVSANIDRLKAEGFTGRTQRTAAPASTDIEVPAGRYAIDTEDGAINETAFYKVDHGKDRWAGRVFVSRMVGGHDDIAVKDPKTRATILAKIAADPEAASLRFGREIGVCGRCGITLTNDESRARGIGPECAKKGW
jgi:hypothetical protein